MSRTRKKQKNRRPTPRQILAVQNLLENGRNQGQALRDAGFSEAVATHPSRVFNSPYVQELLIEAGIDIDATLKQLQRKVFSKKLAHMVFPTYQPPGELPVNTDPDQYLKRQRESLTDEMICIMFEELGCKVRNITHGDMARHVYYWVDNDGVQLEAIEKIINLHGIYAPKKLDTKATIGVFSLSSLRKKMEDEGYTILPGVGPIREAEIVESTELPSN